MTRRGPAWDFPLPEPDRKAPAYRWLYAMLRENILNGTLRPGATLPPTRQLAHQCGFARGTVVTAFEMLKSEGYIEGAMGSGTMVSPVLPDDLLSVRAPERQRVAPAARRPQLSPLAQRTSRFSGLEDRASTAFRPNVPALDAFPKALWARIASRRLRGASTRLLMGCDALGFLPLREAIADYLSTSRGVRCTPDQVAIVSGVQEALDLIVRLTVESGDRVYMEDPGYPGAALCFASAGARIAPVPVDDAGMRIPASRSARLAYVTPAHQFPLGVTMSLARRLDLLEWARTADAIIFEDDYDSEFRYLGRPIPALQGLDRDERVVFAGSFNKGLFPSLRLGYLVLPPALISHVQDLRSITARHPPLFEQAILCDFIGEGHFGRHLRRMREIYAERLEVLTASARIRLAGLVEISPIHAGLQTVGWLREGIDARAAVDAAAARNVEVRALSSFAQKLPVREGLQLGFAAVDPKELRRGVRDLALALRSLAP